MRGNTSWLACAIAQWRKCWFSIGFTRENRKPSEFRARRHHASCAGRNSHGGPLETQGISMISKVSAHGSGGGQRVPSVFLTASFAQKACFSKVLFSKVSGKPSGSLFWQAHFAQKACFITVLARFVGARYFWQDDWKEC